MFRAGTALIAVCIASLALGGCNRGGADKPAPSPRQLAGAWVCALDSTVLHMRGDGRFAVESTAAGSRLVRGGFTINGDKITFLNDAQSGECPAVSGTYTLAADGDTLHFTLVSDECPPRTEHMKAAWTRREP